MSSALECKLCGIRAKERADCWRRNHKISDLCMYRASSSGDETQSAILSGQTSAGKDREWQILDMQMQAALMAPLTFLLAFYKTRLLPETQLISHLRRFACRSVLSPLRCAPRTSLCRRLYADNVFLFHSLQKHNVKKGLPLR